MSTSPDNICITRGSQMGLHTLAHCFLSPGDLVVFEELTYPPAVQAFQALGAKTRRVPHTNGGMDLDKLEELCRSTPIRAIYTTPHHQFPMTFVMRIEHRMRLKTLAEEYNFLIFEDDYDHEFHFDSNPVFPLASNDESGRVIYVGSFSKILAPSLRVGFIAANRELTEFIARTISVVDRQGNPISELAVVEMIESGQLSRHIRRSHPIYKKRRQRFYELTQDILSPWCEADFPNGGLAFWLNLLEPVDKLKHERLRREAGLQYLPSNNCAALGTTVDTGMRLGFASITSESMEEALMAVRGVLSKLS